jgi:hypothetical protein
MLLNKAIGLENKRKELCEHKRKFQSQGQSSSNTRPRYNSSQDSQFCSCGQGGNYGQNRQFYRSFEQPEKSNLLTQNVHSTPITQQAEQSWLHTRRERMTCQSIFPEN